MSPPEPTLLLPGVFLPGMEPIDADNFKVVENLGLVVGGTGEGVSDDSFFYSSRCSSLCGFEPDRGWIAWPCGPLRRVPGQQARFLWGGAQEGLGNSPSLHEIGQGSEQSPFQLPERRRPPPFLLFFDLNRLS